MNAPDRTDIVTVCAWCPQLHILKLEGQPGDEFQVRSKVDADGTRLHAYWRWRQGQGWRELAVSHGVCAACRAQHFPESVNAEVNI